MELILNGSPFVLLSQKALYKADERLLIIADVHLGKAAHFRKAGIAIPQQTQQDDYNNLRTLLAHVQPLKVYFLGDLFHSDFNMDWRHFCDLVAAFPDICFTLVRGNHDVIDDRMFRSLCIEVVDYIEDQHFLYTHEPQSRVPPGKLNFAGHIHPGYRLYGTAHQSVILPCFYATPKTFILPAFGILTGLYNMGRGQDSDIYLVTPGGVRRWDG